MKLLLSSNKHIQLCIVSERVGRHAQLLVVLVYRFSNLLSELA